MKKKSCFIVFCILTINVFAQSLKTSNIHYRTIDDKIEIFYDLPVNNDSISVKVVFYKKSGSKFRYHPKYISGAVGIGKFSGKQNKITWYFKKEPPWVFTGSGFYFKVIVYRHKID